ncbi:MarR family winged helix-turn-helix transcriptional regulator [Streptomyces sp. GQFP]|uniref:MarR family winged helix-turn-helix transcriptional regulator n=1 Tax=Streptomyces sp. GQFP TaxID=2907545 RepID=UPI001F2F7378|nr:MarR family winged helix-turn-helix transcriptional regulator [Streptomyces sp. GQFP]UIX31951.1 MarR family winged helix-turn-helix transcriptional regulator [Streptomyces sp. GQFP]
MNETPRWLTAAEGHAWRSFVDMQGKLLGRLGRQLQADSNLSTADYTVLAHLSDAPDGRLRFLELAKAVEWEKSRMSHHIGRMTKRGLVIREECLDDGRGFFAVITPAGREAITAAAPLHVEAVRRLAIDHLTPEEISMLGRISDRILDQLEKDSS